MYVSCDVWLHIGQAFKSQVHVLRMAYAVCWKPLLLRMESCESPSPICSAPVVASVNVYELVVGIDYSQQIDAKEMFVVIIGRATLCQ